MLQHVEFKGTLEEVVKDLLEAKARGEHLYGDFNGHVLCSDTVTMDSAYLEVTGYTKAEFDKIRQETADKRKQDEMAIKQKELLYKEMVEKNRKEKGVVPITMPVVIEGLKFIAENRDLNQEDLINGLLDLGCNFTFEDMEKTFSKKVLLTSGMRDGDLSCGASIILNARDDSFGRSYVNEQFLDVDFHDDVYDDSVYHFIRLVTGNKDYTKENIDAMKNTNNHTR